MRRKSLAVPCLPESRAHRGGLIVLPPDHLVAYFDFRDLLAADIRAGLVGQTPAEIMGRARKCAGVDTAIAAEWTERFFNDLKRHLRRRHGIQ